jgi:hypothetical protein
MKKSLLTFIVAKPYSSYIRTALSVIIFFAFLHLFVKITWKMAKLIPNFNIDGNWFNYDLISFISIVALSALFTQFVMTSVIVIEDERVVVSSATAINKLVKRS